ncbi:MAG: protein-methionine-sulfoxide reductase heme-binding subunit MsrQ [Gemmatimonadales bacterium]
MTPLQWITRVVKPAAFIGASVPLLILLRDAFLGGDLGPDPVRHIQHVTGIACLALLLLTLTITPLRRYLHLGQLIKLRRMLGLWAFTYAALHLLTYLIFDQSLDASRILADTVKHPRIYFGFAAFLILLALALTSTDASVRRLGKRWVTLHRLIYVAVILGVIHFAMVQKLDYRIPLIWGAGFLVLMALRIRIPVASRSTPSQDAVPSGVVNTAAPD